MWYRMGNRIFDTTKGIEYIKFLAPFFIFLYLEGPLASTY